MGLFSLVVALLFLVIHALDHDGYASANPVASDNLELTSIAQPRIIGGTAAVPGTHPFLVSLLGSSGSHSCGGTLIAPDIVLSAAHCTGLSSAQVGRSNRDDPNDDYEEFGLVLDVPHPGYNAQFFQYDYMILQLDGLSTKSVITLNQDETLPTPLIEQGVKAVGFGVTEFYYDGSHGPPASILQEAYMTAISNEECEQSKDPESTDAALKNGYENLINAAMLCAGGPNVDTCLGDSGGPLLLLLNETEAATGTEDTTSNVVQVGITSWGFGCGSSDFPGVYSRVSHQFEWIREEVCKLSAAPPDYFDCNRTTLPPAQNVSLTLIVSFDDYPEELGWVLVDETGFGVLLADVAPGDIVKSDAQSTVAFSYTAQERSRLSFHIFDIEADGLCCPKEGWYQLVIGTQESPIQVLASGVGNFGSGGSFTFEIPSLADLDTISRNATPIPNATLSDTPSAVPSSAPSRGFGGAAPVPMPPETGASPAPTALTTATAVETPAPTLRGTTSALPSTILPVFGTGSPAVDSISEAPSTGFPSVLPTNTSSSPPSAPLTNSVYPSAGPSHGPSESPSFSPTLSKIPTTAPSLQEAVVADKSATLEPSQSEGTTGSDCDEAGNGVDCEVNNAFSSSSGTQRWTMTAILLITATVSSR